VKPFAATAVLVASLLTGQQQQSSSTRAGWPCGARLDTSFFQVAEGTGGHLLLLSPEEISDSTALLTAFGSHPQTIFRLAGILTPGPHEFQLPIDSSVESVLFSISVQCLEVVDVFRPSGVTATGDNVIQLSNFRAERMVIVKRPEPGIWTVRVSGSGVSGVVVQAKSSIGLGQVDFAPIGSTTFTAIPSAGIENAVKIRVSGYASELQASLVNGVFLPIAKLPLQANEADRSYVSRFTPGVEGFRVVIAGKDSDGFVFQRVHAPLFTPVR
jgi:hypothetical protein